MITIKRYRRGVLGVLKRVKMHVPDMGEYESHSFHNESQIIVVLTNGTLKMPEEAAHTQEFFPENLLEDWIRAIGHSFERYSPAALRKKNRKSVWEIFVNLFS